MIDCNHKNSTIDCVCNDCGYDSIVDAARQDAFASGVEFEQERIIKLLEAHPLITNDELGITYCGKEDCEGDLSFDYDASLTQHYIALIKGKN